MQAYTTFNWSSLTICHIGLSSVAKGFELQGAANSSPTRKNCSEGAQFLLVLKSARKFARYLGIFQLKNPKYSLLGAKIREHNLNE